MPRLILAGALSNLLQKEREAAGTHRDSVRLLKELLDYKPGLKLYFENALKSSEFAGMTGHFHLCVLLPQDSAAQNTERQAESVSALSEFIWAFDHHGTIIVLFNTGNYTPESFHTLIAPLADAEQMQAGCSISFDELLKLRYVYEDTRSALELACAEERDTRYHKSERYLARVFLQRCRKLLPAEEYYPDFFRRLIEHDVIESRGALERAADTGDLVLRLLTERKCPDDSPVHAHAHLSPRSARQKDDQGDQSACQCKPRY